jgi:hypothetical protein
MVSDFIIIGWRSEGAYSFGPMVDACCQAATHSFRGNGLLDLEANHEKKLADESI